MSWLAQAIIATLCFAVMILLFSQLTQLGIQTTVINFYFFAFSAVGFLFVGLVVQKTPLVFPIQSLALFLALGCISVVANYFALSAISNAPNPGLVRTVQSMEAVFVTIGAVFLYNAKVEPRQAIGIILMLLGLFLISYRSG